ncbi:MAG: hypothetical protein K2H82_09720 [Oscillospiraceae bacterium]|nr:hypothetical protein [Oscillospiraceae bacterium]
MFFKLILENENGDRIDMTTTANQYMTSKIKGLMPPAGTINQTNNSSKVQSRLKIYRLIRNALNV